MARTKDQWMQLAVNEMTKFPTVAARYQIGDPMVTQILAGQCAVLAELDYQVEMTAGETYIKARDVTVLADAAVKGILPFATPSIGTIKVTNASADVLRITSGRTLQDQQGRYWVVMAGAVIAAGAVGSVTAKQITSRTLSHTVTAYRPFYTVDLSEPDVGYIANVLVSGFQYSTDFANTDDADRVYNIKSNERSELSLQFGIAGLAGYQPAVGETLAITIQDTEGAISLSVGMKFAFEYASGVQDAKVTLELSEVSQAGAAPMDIDTMREVCSYPGIYDDSAVFLSNFDFVVRKGISPLTFLSIWNEAREEEARDQASIDNINHLFIAARKAGTTPAILKTQITAILKRADDSYRYRFVDVVDVEVPLKLVLSIPAVYDSGEAIQQARAVMLKEYGKESAWAKRGEARILEKDIHDQLKEAMPVLRERVSNLQVAEIGASDKILPEHFRYITEESLVITAQEVS